MDEKLNRMQTGAGFIAALDQSGGSTPKALLRYGIEADAYKNDEEMFDLVHQMRARIITSPAFTKEHILAAILFERTMDSKIDGLYTADYLWDKKGILPILKVDKGLAEEKDGVQLMRDIPGLDELLRRASERHIFGTKMRSVIKAADPAGIKAVVAQQFEIAKRIAAAGLYPIIEPEVDIHIPDKKQAEALLKTELKTQLAQLDDRTLVLFKLTIPDIDGFYSELMEDRHVVRVVALSGGYSREEADEKLARNPGLIASFSRALTEGLNVKQSAAEFDKMLSDSIAAIYAASMK